MRQFDFYMMLVLIILSVLIFSVGAMALPQYVHAQDFNSTAILLLNDEIRMLRADAGQIVSFAAGLTCAGFVCFALSGRA